MTILLNRQLRSIRKIGIIHQSRKPIAPVVYISSALKWFIFSALEVGACCILQQALTSNSLLIRNLSADTVLKHYPTTSLTTCSIRSFQTSFLPLRVRDEPLMSLRCRTTLFSYPSCRWWPQKRKTIDDGHLEWCPSSLVSIDLFSYTMKVLLQEKFYLLITKVHL